MSVQKRETGKSIIFEFDGYSEFYGAFVQGAFVGTFIVPKQWAHLIEDGNEYQSLEEMRGAKRYGVVLRGAGSVA